MPSTSRRSASSLTECFEPRFRTALRRPGRAVADLRAVAVAHSPVHFPDGDMRRDYGWTRALLTAVATAGGVALACRLLLTGAFVALVSQDLSLVLAFNVCVTLLLGRLLFGFVEPTPRTRRRIVSPRPWRQAASSAERRRLTRFSVTRRSSSPLQGRRR